MQDLPSHRTTIGTLSRFINKHCLDHVLYLASESSSDSLSQQRFPDMLYAYLSGHIEVRLRNARTGGDRLLLQLFYDLIEDAPQIVWTTLASYYLEVFRQTPEPESGNWMVPDPLD